MATEKFDYSVPEKILLALKFSAQQCNAPLSAWIAFCCCTHLPADAVHSLRSRRTKPATRVPSRVSTEDIKSSGDKSVRTTLSCRTKYREAWANQAANERLKIGHWITRCCSSFLDPSVASIVDHLLPQDSPNHTNELGFKLMSLYYRMDDKRSQGYWLDELCIADIALASHLTIENAALLDDLNLVTNRLLELCNCDDRFLLGNSEIDSKLRYYFRTIKRKTVRTEQEKLASRALLERAIESLRKAGVAQCPRNAVVIPKPKDHLPISALRLCSNCKLTESEKVERARTAEILFNLQQLANNGATREQLLDAMNPIDRFTQYVATQVNVCTDPTRSLQMISAHGYLDSLG